VTGRVVSLKIIDGYEGVFAPGMALARAKTGVPSSV